MYIEETVDRESQQKLYVQIFSIIKGKIEKGEWTTGTQIPTEDELCRTYDVSKATVRIAISELVREGFLKRWQGKGTFVTNPVPNFGMAMRTRLMEDIIGEGVRAEKVILAKGVRQIAGEAGDILKAGDGGIYQIVGKRVVEGVPACIDESFFPLALFPGIEDGDPGSLTFYELVQKKSVKRVHKVVQNIELTEIKGEQAEILKVREGSPGLLLHRLLTGLEERPIAYSRLLGSGVKYKIQTEFERIR